MEMNGFSKVKSTAIQDNFPAWTAVCATALPAPDLLVQLPATAVPGNGADERQKGFIY